MTDWDDPEESTATDTHPESNDSLLAYECANGHLTYPPHPVCPTCGNEQIDTVDLTDSVGEVITWTTVTATPPGVREPNTLAIVSFAVGNRSVRILGGVTTDDITVGDSVQPVHVDQLRDPDECLRAQSSQRWDGHRFEPIEENSTDS